jgi:hypothetical protein
MENVIRMSGRLSLEYFGGYHKLKVIDDGGFKVDVIGRILEFYENYPNCKFRVEYYVSDESVGVEEKECVKSKTVVGYMEVGYEKNEYEVDECRTDVDYECILKVGKCDIYRDLIICNGKYVSIEVTPIQKEKQNGDRN